MEKKKVLSGSVQEKGDKLYAVIGYTDPLTEKRKTKWIGLDLPKGEKKAVVNKALRDTIDRFQEQYEKECRGILSPESCSFLDFLHSWLVNVKKPNVQKSTYDGYEELINRRITAFFGDKLTLGDINQVRINEFYASIRADGCKEKTVLEYHNLLHDACGWAVRQEILLSNPFDRVDRPKPKKYSACYYSPEQVQNRYYGYPFLKTNYCNFILQCAFFLKLYSCLTKSYQYCTFNVMKGKSLCDGR